MTTKNNIIKMLFLIVVLALVFWGGYAIMNFFGGHYSGFLNFNWLFGIVLLITTIVIVFYVLTMNKKLSNGMKILWLMFALFFNIIINIVLYIVVRKK